MRNLIEHIARDADDIVVDKDIVATTRRLKTSLSLSGLKTDEDFEHLEGFYYSKISGPVDKINITPFRMKTTLCVRIV